MKVKASSIIEFLEGRKESFLIPVYQRNYDWKEDRCKVLWDDLIGVVSTPHPHFFGSLVRVRNGDDNIIIDGQQRLTTVSLLMLAIAHRIEDLGLDKPDLKEIMDVFQNGKRQPKIKLKLLREDMQAYECIVANKNDCSQYSKSNIIKNYKFFLKKLDSENIENIFEASKKLIVIDTLLEDGDDNPQAVFESLNDKGEKLKDADKIRNFILINFDYEKQQHLYEEYWAPMEKNAGLSSDDTTKYIKSFLEYKTNIKMAGAVYTSFKDFVKNKEKEDVLAELRSMSVTYKIICHQKVQGDGAEEINERLGMLLNDLKMGTMIPLLLDLIQEYNAQSIPHTDVIEILDILITFVVRCALAGTTNANYAQFFLMNKSIHDLLSKFPGGTYLDIVKYKMVTATAKNQIPNDDTVKENILNLGVYNKNQTVCRYVLVQLEKHLMKQKDPKSQRQLNPIPLTIEHIMPQTLSGVNGDIWKRDLGDNWDDIHRKYLHTLGNLTLTAYNQNLKNSPFKKKKQELQSFAPLYLNEYLEHVDTWNEDTIQERGKKLSQLVLRLWPVPKPQNDYMIEQNVDSFSLDNNDVSNIVLKRKPRHVDLGFSEFDVSSWRDLYITVINDLFSNKDYRQKMQNAFDWADKSDRFQGIISNAPQQVRGSSGSVLWEQILSECQTYFMTTKSADGICVALRKWCEYLDIDPADVNIFLR